MHLFGHSLGGPTVFAACHYDLMARLHDLAKRQLSACPQALEFEAGKVVTLQGAMSGFLLDSRFSNSSTVLWSLTSLNLVNPATLHLDRYKEVAGAPSRAGFALRYLVACIDGGKVYPSLVHTIIDLVRQCAQLNRAEKHAFENLVREVFFPRSAPCDVESKVSHDTIIAAKFETINRKSLWTAIYESMESACSSEDRGLWFAFNKCFPAMIKFVESKPRGSANMNEFLRHFTVFVGNLFAVEGKDPVGATLLRALNHLGDQLSDGMLQFQTTAMLDDPSVLENLPFSAIDLGTPRLSEAFVSMPSPIDGHRRVFIFAPHAEATSMSKQGDDMHNSVLNLRYADLLGRLLEFED